MKNLRKMASAAAAACATAVVASATAVNANPEPFPVVAWGAFTQEQACRERFLEAKDAGFTHVTQWCDTPADGAGAVVSWLRNGGKDYLVVVNRDPNRDMKFVATFVPGAGIVRRDGTTASAAAYADYFWLDPGDAAIFAATAKESK